MSAKHPIIAVTGSSGAGTTSVKKVFDHIFNRESIRAAVIEGDSFHRYNREEMKRELVEATHSGKHHYSHFGPEANLFEELAATFKRYGETGAGKLRKYLHNDLEAAPYNRPPGTFTEWEDMPESDLLFYEGLHGGVVTDSVNVAQHIDLLIGVTPIVNLEWIQKIHRDMNSRGYRLEDVRQTILRRMYDYVHYITPQFSRTDVNFQRVALVDTSNPFVARDIPTADESMVVIRYRKPKGTDFPYLLSMIQGSFMTRPNCIVVPGGRTPLAMQLILTPLILQLIERKNMVTSVKGEG